VPAPPERRRRARRDGSTKRFSCGVGSAREPTSGGKAEFAENPTAGRGRHNPRAVGLPSRGGRCSPTGSSFIEREGREVQSSGPADGVEGRRGQRPVDVAAVLLQRRQPGRHAMASREERALQFGKDAGPGRGGGAQVRRVEELVPLRGPRQVEHAPADGVSSGGSRSGGRIRDRAPARAGGSGTGRSSVAVLLEGRKRGRSVQKIHVGPAAFGGFPSSRPAFAFNGGGPSPRAERIPVASRTSGTTAVRTSTR